MRGGVLTDTSEWAVHPVPPCWAFHLPSPSFHPPFPFPCPFKLEPRTHLSPNHILTSTLPSALLPAYHALAPRPTAIPSLDSKPTPHVSTRFWYVSLLSPPSSCVALGARGIHRNATQRTLRHCLLKLLLASAPSPPIVLPSRPQPKPRITARRCAYPRLDDGSRRSSPLHWKSSAFCATANCLPPTRGHP